MTETIADPGTWLPRWMAPAVVVGLCSVAYTLGVMVGENRNAIVIAALEQRLESHQNIRVHSGAVTIGEYEADQRALAIQLERVYDQLDRIEDLIDTR